MKIHSAARLFALAHRTKDIVIVFDDASKQNTLALTREQARQLWEALGAELQSIDKEAEVSA